MLRQMSNDELFLKYHPELRIRIHNEINLKNDIALLDKFRKFLGDSRPSLRSLNNSYPVTTIAP